MSLPALFLSPSCPCSGSPEDPVNGFIGGHDCRQRCGQCPSVTIEYTVERKNVMIGGQRQHGDDISPPEYYLKKTVNNYTQSDYEAGTAEMYVFSDTEPLPSVVDEECCGSLDPCGGEQRLPHDGCGGFTCERTWQRATGGSGIKGRIFGYHPDQAGADIPLVGGGAGSFLIDAGESLVETNWQGTGCECSGEPLWQSPFWGPLTTSSSAGPTGVLSPIKFVEEDSTESYTFAAAPPSTYWTSWRGNCTLNSVTVDDNGVSGSIDTVRKYDCELSDHYSEADALAAAAVTEEPGLTGTSTPTVGYELRTARHFQWARVEYSIVARGLREGVTYQVRPKVEEGQWIRGQAIVWNSVPMDWEQFTATVLDEAEGRKLEQDALEPVRGWAQRVAGVEIKIV